MLISLVSDFSAAAVFCLDPWIPFSVLMSLSTDLLPPLPSASQGVTAFFGILSVAIPVWDRSGDCGSLDFGFGLLKVKINGISYNYSDCDAMYRGCGSIETDGKMAFGFLLLVTLVLSLVLVALVLQYTKVLPVSVPPQFAEMAACFGAGGSLAAIIIWAKGSESGSVFLFVFRLAPLIH